MRNYCIRREIRKIIRYHEKSRRSIIQDRVEQPNTIGEWEKFVEQENKMWHDASCEYRCAERLRKLLDKYR